MKKITVSMNDFELALAKGWTLVRYDNSVDVVLFIPPLGSEDRPYIRLINGTKIEISSNMVGALREYEQRESALEDLNWFMEDNESDGISQEEIEENKEDIIDKYCEYQNDSDGWWDDMRNAIHWTLGLKGEMNMKPFKELSREERMAELLEHANAILNRIHPGRGLTIEYMRMDDEHYALFSDWDIKYHQILHSLEYFVISESRAYPLYVVNITADSEMTAMDELFRLLGRKF